MLTWHIRNNARRVADMLQPTSMIIYAFHSHYRRDAWAYVCTVHDRNALLWNGMYRQYIPTYGSWRTYGNWSCTGGRWHEDALNVKARTRWTAWTRRPSLFGLHARLMHFAKGTVASRIHWNLSCQAWIISNHCTLIATPHCRYYEIIPRRIM